MKSLRSVLAAAILAGVASLAQAASAELKSVDIPAGDLTAALELLAKQSGVEVVYRPEQLKGVRTKGVQGSLSSREAVTRLLEGTALTLRIDRSGVLLITEAGTPVPGVGSEALAGSEQVRLAEGEQNSTNPDTGAGKPEDNTQNVQGQASAGPKGEKNEELKEFDMRGIPEILVRGARALNTDIGRTPDDAQPYVVFDRDIIEKSGADNIESFLKTRLTMTTNANTSSQGVSAVGNSSSINLRGLGANQTLILVDGHRVAGANFNGDPQQPDLNGIPLAAIQRIEILPTTASGIYGGGATGGVVNVILRRDYSGAEAKVTYGSSFEGDAANRRVDVSAGMNLGGGRTNILLAGSYANADALLVRDREYAQRARATVFANNPAFFLAPSVAPPLGATTNIRSNAPLVGGVRPNLTLKASNASLGSPYTSVPVGYAGTGTDGGAALIARAGQYNLDLANTAQGGNASLLNEPKVESLVATVRHEFTGSLRSFIELGASNNSGYFRTSRANATFNMPVNASNNPFNQPITVTTPVFGADGTLVSTNYDRRIVGGLILKLSDDWHLEGDYAWNRVRFYASTPTNITTEGSAAVTSGAIDVLRDTNQFPVDFSTFVDRPDVIAPTHSTMKDATVRVAGSLLRLPAGPLTVSTLIEHRDEQFDDASDISPTSQTYFPSRSQSVSSVYIETKLPIVSDRNRIPGIELLELQAAGRRDAYNVDGANTLTSPTQPVVRFRNYLSSIDPTFGLRWKPTRDVMIRGSYGTGFLPPSVIQLVPGITTSIPAATAALLPFTDPRRGNERLGAFTIASGGSPDLQPEQSKSWSAGLVLTPRMAAGLRLSVDWTKITKTDDITNFTLSQANIGNEAFVPGLIVRGPVSPGDPLGVGKIVEFNASKLFNIAQLRVEAYDFGVNYQLESSRAGNFDFDLGATRLMHLETQVTPATAVVENVGVTNAIINTGDVGGGLRWKANGAITWNYRSWEAGWIAHFFDSYWLNLTHTVNVNQGAAKVPSQIYHDIFASWSLPSGIRLQPLSGTRIRFGVTNVFNTSPPQDVVGVLNFNPLGYSYWGDPRRASYYISLTKAF